MLIKIFKVCLVLLLIQGCDLPTQQVPPDDQLTNLEDQQKPLDLNQYGKTSEDYAIATSSCLALAKTKTRYQVKWAAGWTKWAFDNFDWLDETHQKILYVGKNLLIENQYGAWQSGFTYSCLYDLGTKQITYFMIVN